MHKNTQMQMQNTNAKYKYNNTMQQKEYNRGVTPSTQKLTKCIKMYFKNPNVLCCKYRQQTECKDVNFSGIIFQCILPCTMINVTNKVKQVPNTCICKYQPYYWPNLLAYLSKYQQNSQCVQRVRK